MEPKIELIELAQSVDATRRTPGTGGGFGYGYALGEAAKRKRKKKLATAKRKAPAARKRAKARPGPKPAQRKRPTAAKTRKNTGRIATRRTPAKKTTARGMAWWKSLTVKQKKTYLKEHPNSKYGKTTRADGSAKKGLELRAATSKRKPAKVTTKAKRDTKTAKAVKTKRRSKTAIPKSWAWFHPGAKKAVRKSTKVTTKAKRDTKAVKAVKKSATKRRKSTPKGWGHLTKTQLKAAKATRRWALKNRNLPDFGPKDRRRYPTASL